jgi:hypothetical protein
MTAIAVGSIFAVTLVAVVWTVKKLPRGCWGECRQGRDQCHQECEDKNANSQ